MASPTSLSTASAARTDGRLCADPRRRRKRLGLAPGRKRAARGRARPDCRRSPVRGRIGRLVGLRRRRHGRSATAAVIVSGHSLGGFTAPLVCLRSVDLLVLVAAMIPSPGELFDNEWANSRYQAVAPTTSSTTTCIPTLQPRRSGANETRTRRLREPCALAAWPGTSTRYLLCRDDRMFPAAVGAPSCTRASGD